MTPETSRCRRALGYIARASVLLWWRDGRIATGIGCAAACKQSLRTTKPCATYNLTKCGRLRRPTRVWTARTTARFVDVPL